jgi:hypothetical protein
LSEAAITYIIQNCEKQAMLYHSQPALTSCYRHMEACSCGITLIYEVLQLSICLDSKNRQLFAPLFPGEEGHGPKTTFEENVDVFAFSPVQNKPSTMGTIFRDWDWKSPDEMADDNVKGVNAPLGATRLQLLREDLPISSLLIGIEGSAPLKECAFGLEHGVDGKSKHLSCFGKRKWRDFHNGSQQTPAEFGGMRVSINGERFDLFKKVCSELCLAKPSELKHLDQEDRDEAQTFRMLLRSSGQDIVRILGPLLQMETSSCLPCDYVKYHSDHSLF